MNFIVALHPEARPIIERYGLEKRLSSIPFSFFENEKHQLIISGIGRINAAAATGYLLSQIDESPQSIINLGIAGHGNLNIGTPFIANRVICPEEKVVHYPTPILDQDIERSALQTCNTPEKAYRGPVGVEIAVQGRGLTKYDSITFGDKKTQTRYLSENELRFTVPALPSGIDYPVQLIGGPHGALDIGNFRIDKSPLGVVPSSLEIASGDSANLLFKIDYEAPSGGLDIEVKTNIPESIVMPEAKISEGDRTINIPVQGGAPGEGKLIITAPGYDSVEIPVRVF